MIDFSEVMQRIKTLLASKTKNDKVLDKDIALALNMNPQNFAVIKRRQRIPFEAIAYFSKKHKISMNWILFAQKPKNLT